MKNVVSSNKSKDESIKKETSAEKPNDVKTSIEKASNTTTSTQINSKVSAASIQKEASADKPNEVKATNETASNMTATQNKSKDSAASNQEASALQPNDVKATVEIASNMIAIQNSAVSNQKEASAQPNDVKTASNIKTTQEMEKTVEIIIDEKSVEVTPILKNAGSSKIEKTLVVETSTTLKSVEITESVSDKVKEPETISDDKNPNSESELNTAEEIKPNDADSGIISDKSLDSSIINDKIVEKSSNDELKKSVESAKNFSGAFEFLNDYFEKSNEFISSIDLTQSSSDEQQSSPKENTLFDMVKKRADDIRLAEIVEVKKVTAEEPIASTSTAFPLCFNTSSSSICLLKPVIGISPGKRGHSIMISDGELSPIAKKFKPADSLKVNIINDNVPNGFLNYAQELQIINKLTYELDLAMVTENIMPKFEKCISSRGFLLIICADAFSKKWLEKIVPTLSVWKTSCLRVVNAYCKSEKFTRVKVYIPGVKEPGTKVLERLCRMNPGISTIGWRIYDRSSSRYGETMTLGIDKTSLANLKLINYQAYYGLTRLDFKIVK